MTGFHGYLQYMPHKITLFIPSFTYQLITSGWKKHPNPTGPYIKGLVMLQLK